MCERYKFVIIRIHRGQLAWFRERARRTYPLETMALLVGQRISPQVVGVAYLYYPKTTPIRDGVEVDMTVREYQELCEVLKDRQPGLRVLGNIHSHPDDSPIMSEEDAANHRACGDAVTGILTVRTKGRSSVEFWQSKDCLPLKLEYYK